MKYGSSLFISILVHLFCFGMVYIKPYKCPSESAIEVELIPSSQNRKHHTPSVQKTVNTPRMGNPAYMRPGRPLGQRLSAENYIDRLRQHIEPHWRRFVADELRGKAFPGPCISVLSIDADAQGNIIAIKVTSTTCSKTITSLGEKSIKYAGLLPPPKDILVDNKLYLEWAFEIKE